MATSSTAGRLGSATPSAKPSCDDLSSRDTHRLAAEIQEIYCSGSRCITARARRRALQVRVDTGAGGARPGSIVVLYRTTQPDIAVQDTERSAAGSASG